MQRTIAGLVVEDEFVSFHRIVTSLGPSSAAVVPCDDLPSMRSKTSLIADMSPSSALSASLLAMSCSWSTMRPSASSICRRSARMSAAHINPAVVPPSGGASSSAMSFSFRVVRASARIQREGLVAEHT
jgi:hypothetical protein